MRLINTHEISRSECHTENRGCDWSRSRNTTISGKTCMEWVQPVEDYEHVPFVDNLNYVLKNGIKGNPCLNPDQEILGPWCYTTDPDTRFEFCGVCEVDLTKTVEYGHHNDSWIPVIEDIYLANNPGMTSSSLDFNNLQKDLREFEKLRRVRILRRLG